MAQHSLAAWRTCAQNHAGFCLKQRDGCVFKVVNSAGQVRHGAAQALDMALRLVLYERGLYLGAFVTDDWQIGFTPAHPGAGRHGVELSGAWHGNVFIFDDAGRLILFVMLPVSCRSRLIAKMTFPCFYLGAVIVRDTRLCTGFGTAGVLESQSMSFGSKLATVFPCAWCGKVCESV